MGVYGSLVACSAGVAGSLEKFSKTPAKIAVKNYGATADAVAVS